MGWEVPAREAGDEDRAAKCTDESSDGYASVEYALCGVLVEGDAVYLHEGGSGYLSQVDDGVAEVEGGEGDVEHDQ